MTQSKRSPTRRRTAIIITATLAALLALTFLWHLRLLPGPKQSLADAGPAALVPRETVGRRELDTGRLPASPNDSTHPADQRTTSIPAPTGQAGESRGPTVGTADAPPPAAEQEAPEPDVNPRTGRPLGALRPGDILESLRSAKPLVVDCYARALTRDPSLAGRVGVQFTIVAQHDRGRVAEADILDSELDSPFFEACVLQALTTIDFPTPLGAAGAEVQVSLPFDFDPGDGYGGDEWAEESKRFPGQVRAQDKASTKN